MYPLQLGDPKVETLFEMSAVPKILYQALLEAIDCSFVIMDRDYRLGTIAMDGEEQPSMRMEQRCYEAVFNSDRPCANCPVTVLFEEGRLTAAKKCFSLPDESKTLWLEVRAYPLFDNQYNVAYAITAFRLLQTDQIDSETPGKEPTELQQVILEETSESELRRFFDGKVGQSLMKLSKREAEILRLMADGMTNAEIANILSISPNTVKCHTMHIFNKLGVNNRTQASVLLVEA